MCDQIKFNKNIISFGFFIIFGLSACNYNFIMYNLTLFSFVKIILNFN